jgi:hypothetical protein
LFCPCGYDSGEIFCLEDEIAATLSINSKRYPVNTALFQTRGFVMKTTARMPYARFNIKPTSRIIHCGSIKIPISTGRFSG